jgi:hypothetical protein
MKEGKFRGLSAGQARLHLTHFRPGKTSPDPDNNLLHYLSYIGILGSDEAADHVLNVLKLEKVNADLIRRAYGEYTLVCSKSCPAINEMSFS